MRHLGLVVVAFAIFSLTACSKKDDKPSDKGSGTGTPMTTEEKLLGKWEVTKTSKGAAPKGAGVEFKKDGKVSMFGEGGSVDATYKVDGDKVMVVVKVGEKEQKQTLKIKTLTDTQLVTEDEEKTVDEYKKK